MAFPKQEYGSGLPFPSPGNLGDPGIEPTSPALAGGQQPLAGGLFTTEPPGKLTVNTICGVKCLSHFCGIPSSPVSSLLNPLLSQWICFQIDILKNDNKFSIVLNLEKIRKKFLTVHKFQNNP